MAENNLLKTERDKRGWSQTEVADKIKCGAASYHRWEAQGVFPSPYYRRKLSDTLRQIDRGVKVTP